MSTEPDATPINEPQRPTPTPPPVDLTALRLPPNYGTKLGVKKVPTTVPIGKPSNEQFFRVHPGEEWSITVLILENKAANANEIYVVDRAVAPLLGTLVRPAQLHLAVDRAGNPFLIPVHLPDESGRRNSWHESRAQAVEHAKKRWVRIEANRAAGRFDILEAQGNLPEPVWPDTPPAEFFMAAFRGKVIDNEQHPIVQSMLGRA